MRFRFLVILLICSNITYAQFVEKVFLKDSITVHEGWIVEQVPQEYVKILRFKERDTLTIEVGEIWKISRIIDIKKINKFFKAPVSAFRGRQQAVFVELLGNAGVYSINYDTRLKKAQRNGWGLRAGFSYLKIKDSSTFGDLTARTISIPLEVNYVIGKRRSALDLGTGITLVSSRFQGRSFNYDNIEFYGSDPFNIVANGAFGYINIGYRYRSLNNGLFFKIAFTPMILPTLLPAAGLSLGYSFNRK